MLVGTAVGTGVAVGVGVAVLVGVGVGEGVGVGVGSVTREISLSKRKEYIPLSVSSSPEKLNFFFAVYEVITAS